MVKMESDCLGCDWPGGCCGCPYNGHSPHAYCDECGTELDDGMAYGRIDSGECMCEECAKKEGAFDEDGDLNEDEWEHYDACERDEEERIAAEDSYWEWKFECMRDEELERRAV